MPKSKTYQSKKITPKPSTKKTAEIFQLNITPAKAIEIKPNGKYLLIFKRDASTDRELTLLNEALKNLFGKTQVLAIFVEDIDKLKFGEVVE